MQIPGKRKYFWMRNTLPPSSVADPPSIHLPHVSHSYDANCGVFHVGSIFVGSRVDPVEHDYYFFQCISTVGRMKKLSQSRGSRFGYVSGWMMSSAELSVRFSFLHAIYSRVVRSKIIQTYSIQ